MSLLLLGGFIFLAVVPVVLLVRSLQRRHPAADRRVVVRATWWACLVYGAIVVLTTVHGVVIALVESSVTVDASIQSFWPELPRGMEVDDGPGPEQLESGSMTRATLAVSDLATSTRVLLAAGIGVGGLSICAVVLVIALACRHLEAATPFAPVLARACGWAAGFVAVGATTAQALGSIGSSRAAEAALSWSSASWSCRGSAPECPGPDELLPVADWQLHVDLWPIGAALVLGVVAVLLRSGAAMQRDTEGLV